MDAVIQSLRDVLAVTAVKMNTPPAYGVFHISFTLLGFAVCFLVAKRLRNLSDRGNRILLLTVGLVLMVAEVYKQLLLCLVIQPGEYCWGDFPFHLCSVPMYLCVISQLLRPGRLQKSLYTFMMLYNLLGGGIAFTEPSGLLHSWLPLTVHSCCWHMLLVFIGLYLMHSGRGGFGKEDYQDATKVFLVLCAIAFSINLIFREASNGQINMFFIGPSNSSLIVFKQISELFGWYVSTLVYIPAVCLGSWLIMLFMRLYRKKTELRI